MNGETVKREKVERMRGIHKPKFLPICPVCESKTTVGKVLTISDRGLAKTAYFCSNCLTEWSPKGIIARPMYA